MIVNVRMRHMIVNVRIQHMIVNVRMRHMIVNVRIQHMIVNVRIQHMIVNVRMQNGIVQNKTGKVLWHQHNATWDHNKAAVSEYIYIIFTYLNQKRIMVC